MHRALLIELGETFEAPFRRLRERLTARIERGEVAFFDAPVVGDGNLSKPVSSLKRSLEEELGTILSKLLTFTPDSRTELRLDVFVCANAGERRVVEAFSEVLLTLMELVEKDYDTIFPAHRTGMERRLRVFPIVLLPHGQFCERPRAEMLAAAASFTEQCVDMGAAERESPVDRVFLLDGITSRGIAPLEALVRQAEGFLGVATDSKIREHDQLVDALDRPTVNLGATLGAATFFIPWHALRLRVASRICADLVESLQMLPREAMRIPSPEELVPSFAVLRDDALERALEQLEGHLARAYSSYGLSGIEGAVADLAEIEKRLAAWRSAGLTRPDDSDEPGEIARPDDESGPKTFATLGSLGFGLAMVALAHFVFGLTLLASAGVALFFALAALAVALLIISLSQSKAAAAIAADQAERERAQTRNEGGLTPEQRLDLLTTAAASGRRRGRRLVDAIDALSPHIELSETRAEPPWAWIVSPEALGPVAHDAVRAYSDVDELRTSFESDLPPLEALLDASAELSADDLESFCLEQAAAAEDPALLGHHEVRAHVNEELARFFDQWEHGADPIIDLTKDRHFDTNGYFPLRNALFATSFLSPDVDEHATRHEGPFRRSVPVTDFPEIVLISVRCDIPVESIACFSPYFREDER